MDRVDCVAEPGGEQSGRPVAGELLLEAAVQAGLNTHSRCLVSKSAKIPEYLLCIH
jgi:hypothetical protein